MIEEEDQVVRAGSGSTNNARVANLPISLMGHIINYLSLSETGNFLRVCCCSSIPQTPSIEALRTICHLETPADAEMLRSQLRTFANHSSIHARLLPTLIVHLDLGHFASNEILSHLASYTPKMQSISMVGSSDITVQGLSHLGNRSDVDGKPALKELRFIDVTFCRNITYEDTLALRETTLHLGDSVVIRRQPAWLDGLKATSSNKHFDSVASYPDGSLHYEVSESTRLRTGYFSHIRSIKNNPQHVLVEITLTATPELPNDFRPAWLRFSMKKFTTFRLLEDQTLITATRCEGLCPPVYSSMQAVDYTLIPLGYRDFFYRKNGTRCLEDDSNHHRYMRVDRSKPRALPTRSTPAHVLDAQRSFFREKSNFDFEQSPDSMQAQLHADMGGSADELRRFLETAYGDLEALPGEVPADST